MTSKQRLAKASMKISTSCIFGHPQSKHFTKSDRYTCCKINTCPCEIFRIPGDHERTRLVQLGWLEEDNAANPKELPQKIIGEIRNDSRRK
jgi:hypothetical protein